MPLFAWLCGIIRHKAADEINSRYSSELSLEIANQGEEEDKN